MSERALIHVRVSYDDTLEAWWYEPEPVERKTSVTGPVVYLGEVYAPRVRFYLRRGQTKNEVSLATADVLVRMAQMAGDWRQR